MRKLLIYFSNHICKQELKILIEFNQKKQIIRNQRIMPFRIIFWWIKVRLVHSLLMFSANPILLVFSIYIKVSEMYRNLNKTNIQNPPSWRLRNIAKFLCRKKIYERVFEPQLSDYAEEYLEALSRGAKYHATWIKCRETINFFLLLIVHCPFAKIVDILDKVRKISK